MKAYRFSPSNQFCKKSSKGVTSPRHLNKKNKKNYSSQDASLSNGGLDWKNNLSTACWVKAPVKLTSSEGDGIKCTVIQAKEWTNFRDKRTLLR